MNKVVGAGRFELLRRMGAGGMGVVYEAHDQERELRVALKKLNRADGQTLYRFKKEFRSLQDLDHPNLVHLGELFEDGKDWFFTMELVEGVDIINYVRPGGVLDEARVRSAFAQLANGLMALHVAGKIHRDVKPANVLVTHDGRVVLVDFGLVWETTASRERSDLTVVGTAAYMAPEQAASRALGPAADWYALGAMLYQALTERQPYGGNLLEIFTAKQVRAPAPPRELAPDAPEDLSALALDLMKFAPADRPSAGEVLARLGAPEHASSSGPSRSMSGEPAPFIGRFDELSALDAAFARTVAGRATRAFVVGESGVGKTRLLAELTERIRERAASTLVLRGRCYERESVHYKAFDGVVDALSRHLQRMDDDEVRELLPEGAELLPLVFPVLGRIAPIGRRKKSMRGARDPIALRNRVFTVLRELFRNLTDRRPVVIVIDDYQWADADSELLLSELLHPPHAPPLLVVASSRELPDVLDALVIELGALGKSEARELAALLLERFKGAGGDARAIADECGGHPLFIDEMVRHAALEGDGLAGARLDDAIRARVAALSPSAAHVLELISVVGTPLSHGLLVRAAALDPRELERAISQLRVARMVRAPSPGKLEPYHDRIREATVDAIEPARLRAIHAGLAAAIEASDLAVERPELLVEHLAAAGDARAAASYAERAAERASMVFAFERAAELYRIALEQGEPDPDERRALQRNLADALANAGRGRDAAPLYLSAATGADLNTRVECQRLAARHLLLNGYFDQGNEALAETLREQGMRLPGSHRGALVSLLWQRLRVRLRGTRWRERPVREISDAELARVDVLLDVGEAMGMFDTVAGANFQMRGLRAALRLGEPSRVARALGVEAIYVAAQGRGKLARARQLIGEMHAIAQRSHDPVLEVLAHTADGMIAYLGGELVEASRVLRDTEARFQDLGSRWELNNARLFRMFATRWTGRFAARYRELRELAGDAHRRGDLYTETALRLTSNLVHLARDAPDDAELDLDAVSWRPPEGTFHVQHWWELEARTELALYRGTAAQAVEALEQSYHLLSKSLLMRVQFVRANSRWAWARLLLAAGDAAGRAGTSRTIAAGIARQLAGEGVPYASVWSDLLRAALATGDHAHAHLTAAAERADAEGMPLLAAVARRRHAELAGDPAALTDASAWLTDQGVLQPAHFARVFA